MIDESKIRYLLNYMFSHLPSLPFFSSLKLISLTDKKQVNDVNIAKITGLCHNNGSLMK